MYLHYIKITINYLPYKKKKKRQLVYGEKKEKTPPILSQRNQLVAGPASTVKNSTCIPCDG